MATAITGLVRVTVVAPHTRMDVALPANVPLAELQADLLVQAGASPGGEFFVNDGVKAGGWTLARLGDPPLDADLSPAQLKVKDGEELYFRLAQDTAPATVFDDVIDAVATAALGRAGRWSRGAGRTVGFVVGSVALGGAAATAITIADLAAGIFMLSLGAVALAACWVLSKALGQPKPAVLFGLLSVGCGTIGGALILADGVSLIELGGPQLVTAGCCAVAYAILSGLAVDRAAPLFHSVAVAGFGLVIGASLTAWLDVPPSASAATIGCTALCLLPMVPMTSYRLAQLPQPDIPRNPQELRSDLAALDGELALKRAARADEYLSGLLGACAALLTGGGVWLGLTGTVPAAILCGMLAALMLLKARSFGTIRQRLPLVVGAFGALGALGLSGILGLSESQRLPIVAGCLTVMAALALTHALAVAGRKISPVWGRTGDIVQIILTIGVIPMLLWVWNAYWWVRSGS
ncbi:MAG TPA: type VII secretion integral membrane protein EccD [Stackebrandtia sp.]|uniref:type VII secretion integral membrane protein EccD n=1 Tax=Stackebrandtia sp. TaxID=2023065 RepID=UPI002D3C829A|nr:type VII secretion integral membrane protein EccD [Stackebrandtia sp.]HZE40739.1 type VII secretion integral membrane protein EccD [Stackebrandtia sp.]